MKMLPLEDEDDEGEEESDDDELDDEGSDEEGVGSEDDGSAPPEELLLDGEQAARIRTREANRKACFFIESPLMVRQTS